MSRRQQLLECVPLEERSLMSQSPLPVLLVIADQQHFFYREYNDTRNSLLAAGIGVTVAATTTNPSTAHANTGQGAGNGVVVPNIALANVNPANYSAIAFVGGWGASMYQYAFNDPDFDGDTDNTYQNSFYNGDWNLNDGVIAPQKVTVNNLINAFLAEDKFVAGVCHGVSVLAWARVNGVSPISGKNITVPLRDGSPAMTYNGNFYGNGYVMGQYDQAIANGGLPNSVMGSIGTPGTTTDDVVVDGQIITGSDDQSAAYFGQVLAQEIINALPPENQTPTDITLSANVIVENSAVGTAIGEFSSIDPDAGDTFAYSLVAGPGSSDNGSFMIEVNTLRLNSTVNFENKPSYSLRVQTQDAGGLTLSKIFTINVTNAPESPTNLSLSSQSILEGVNVGTVIGQFSATDPDANEQLSYSFASGDGDEDNAQFTLNGHQLLSNAVFEFGTEPSRSIRIRVTDSTGLFIEAPFTINVQDVNERPSIDITPTLLLPPIARNALQPTGMHIQNLLGSAVDPESHSEIGIAVTGRIGIAGNWEIADSENGPWAVLPLVSETNALLLSRNQYIRFIPSRNLTGFAGLQFRAWDGVSGTALSSINLASNPSAVSEATEIAWAAVGLGTTRFNALNQWNLTSINEDTTNPSGFSAKSMLGMPANLFSPYASIGIAITEMTGNGTWQIRRGSTWEVINPVGLSNALLVKSTDVLRFVPAANWSGDATIRYVGWDRINGITANVADATGFGFTRESFVASVNVKPVNDAPVIDLSVARVFTTEPQSVGTLLAGSADIDSGVAGAAFVSHSARGGRWEYLLNGTDDWKPFPTLSTRSSLLLDPWAEIRFVPTENVTSAKGTLQYKVWDDVLPVANGSRRSISGTAFSVATETATFSLGNQQPTFKAGLEPTFGTQRTGNPGTARSLQSQLSRFVDADQGTTKGLAITGMTGEGTWQYSVDGGRNWQNIGDVLSHRLLLRATDRVRFTPASGWTGTATLNFVAWDGSVGVAGDRLTDHPTAFSTEGLTASLNVIL